MSDLNVIFGTGPLGRSVMKELLAQGQHVKMVNRSGKAEVPSSIQVVAGDVTSVESVRTLSSAAKTVYMCAQPAYTRWPEDFPQMIKAVVEGVSGSGANLVFGDNLYMYGAVEGAIKESLPYAAKTRKGRARALVANTVMEAHNAGKLKATIGRGADFYGPGVLESALGDRVFYPAIAGKAAAGIGNLDIPHTYTYIEDFGRALVTLGEHEQAFGQTWHVPNAPTVTTREILNILFEELGTPPKMSGMGKLMMRIGGIFIPGARETVEMMYEFEKPFVVDSSKFVQTFGVTATPHREAIRKTLEWYRQHPHTK